MRAVTKDTITDAFVGYCANTESARVKHVVERLAAHLHAFAREVELSHEEWQLAIDLLSRAGQISTPERNEFILLSDVLGLSSLVDMINSRQSGTESSVLGPFHIEGARLLEVGGDLIGDNPGDQVVLSGRVLDRDGGAIEGAVLDFWQTAANGLYSNQDSGQPEGNLRCRMRTGADGRYALTTVRPAPYTVPDDGPVGDLLRATGRQPWRPAHFHVMVTADGRPPLITELFPEDDPYLDQDAVFGVRQSLIVPLVPEVDQATLPADIVARDRLSKPFYRIDYDFRL